MSATKSRPESLTQPLVLEEVIVNARDLDGDTLGVVDNAVSMAASQERDISLHAGHNTDPASVLLAASVMGNSGVRVTLVDELSGNAIHVGGTSEDVDGSASNGVIELSPGVAVRGAADGDWETPLVESTSGVLPPEARTKVRNIGERGFIPEQDKMPEVRITGNIAQRILKGEIFIIDPGMTGVGAVRLLTSLLRERADVQIDGGEGRKPIFYHLAST